MTPATPTTGDRPGALLGSLLQGDALAQGRRLLAGGGRVESFVWFRTAIAGQVAAPNKRRFDAVLILDAAHRLRSASCTCSPKLRPDTLCPHLAALALLAARAPSRGALSEPIELPGERFERSLWRHAAEGLFERHGREARVVRESPERALVLASDGAMAADCIGRIDERRWPLLAALLAEDASLERCVSSLSASEQRLVAATQTPEEERLAKRGAQNRRQAFESSPWWLLAKRAFEAGESAATSSFSVELESSRLVLDGRVDELSLRFALTPNAVRRLAVEAPDLLAALPWQTGTVRPMLRLELAPDGALVLNPVYLRDREGASRLFERADAEECCYGPLFLDPEESALLRLELGRRLFAESGDGAQAALDLGDGYRPSVIGQPLDRRTRVGPMESARFLARHAEEIAALPPILLPPELLNGGLAEAEGAELTVVGEEAGRIRLSLVYQVRGRPVPFASILAARRRRDPLLVCAGGLVDLAHPSFAWIDLLPAEALEERKNETRLRLSPLELFRLRSHLPERHELVARSAQQIGTDAARGKREVRDLIRELELLGELSADAPPPAVESIGVPLFDFQRYGYAWLWFLWRHGFGGLLADDMGLGKTYQAIALIGAIAATSPEPPRVLVVCPASVLPHWQEKLRVLVPSIAVRLHHGPEREMSPPGAGVLLTTYGTLRNDAGGLGTTRFDLFVLDEIQTIKNRGTATHEALRQLTARVALGLTGTPIENHVEELRAVLDFVQPGYLPGPALFDRLFAQPIAAGDSEARRRLSRLVRPFVLRRTKEQVLDDLPPKIEERRHCSMTLEQAALYREQLETRGAALRRALDERAPVPFLHVFALLSRLKQICNHPDLVAPAGAARGAIGSGKWELFVEILDEALGSGHKIVVFSQYLGMLAIVAQHLEARGIEHATLTGRTVDRARPLARFRDDPSCRVFLASLRAGGIGIDLTAASVVIHYDRWWNQAREDQATDRVHRIGQRRGVQVITLITEATIEERIDRLIAEKGRLAADLVPADDGKILERFTREELRRLLAS